MSETGHEIRYVINTPKHEIFREAIVDYGNSSFSDSDLQACIDKLNNIGLDGRQIFNETKFWEASFRNLGENKYELIFVSKWNMHEILCPMLEQLGATDIFVYWHDSSWGGDVFSVHEVGETSDVYVSQQDKELDRFLYDNDDDYIGTSFDALYSMYLSGKFNSHESVMEKVIDKELYQTAQVSILTKKKAMQLIIFSVSLFYLIWVIALK
jgi:hypothetical protein